MPQFLRRLEPLILLMVLLCLSSLECRGQTASNGILSTPTLPAGTLAVLQLKDDLYTRDLKPGQPVKFEVAVDVGAKGQIFIPKGTLVRGSVRQVDQTGKGLAKLLIELEPVQTIFGDTVRLSQKEPVTNDTLTMKGVGAAGLEALPLVPVGVLMVLFQREGVFLHKGMNQVAYVAESLEIDPTKVKEGQARLRERLADACRKNAKKPLKNYGDYSSLNNCLRLAGDLDGAIEGYQQALALWPNSAGLHIGLADVYSEKDDFVHAVPEFRRGVQLKPKDEYRREDFVNLLEKSGDLNSALAEVKEAIGVWPNNSFLHYLFGRLLVKENDLDAGIVELQWVLKKEKGKFPAANCSLGDALERKGDLDGALDQYRTAHQADVGDPACNAASKRLQEQLGK